MLRYFNVKVKDCFFVLFCFWVEAKQILRQKWFPSIHLVRRSLSESRQLQMFFLQGDWSILWNIGGKLQNALAPKTTSKISPTLVEITDRQRSSSPKGITPVFKHNTHSSLKRFRVSFCSQFKEIKHVCRVQPLLKGESVSYERILRKGWLNMQTWPKYIYILVLLDIDSRFHCKD